VRSKINHISKLENVKKNHDLKEKPNKGYNEVGQTMKTWCTVGIVFCLLMSFDVVEENIISGLIIVKNKSEFG